MVYRGKLSAGCSNCRKAKKRCDLTLPECSRCVKSKQQCTGYRDVSQLQVEDESAAVASRVSKKNNTLSAATAKTRCSNETTSNLPGPRECSNRSSLVEEDRNLSLGDQRQPIISDSASPDSSIIFTMKPRMDDLASMMFYGKFATSGYWDFLARHVSLEVHDPVLKFAIRACGMASFNNTSCTVDGQNYARFMYSKALGLLNQALRDPLRFKRDESLAAVVLLTYYENITCENAQSVRSWKMHVRGATQMLQLRGKQQFNSSIGRVLFRELRSTVVINCIWNDEEPPAFLWDWNEELQQNTDIFRTMLFHSDRLVKAMIDLARLRADMTHQRIDDADAMSEILRIDTELIQWSADAIATDMGLQYTEQHVPDSPDVWNGLIHTHKTTIGASMWNGWRTLRILASRTQEVLCSRFSFSTTERDEQHMYCSNIRRQMCDEICATMSGLYDNNPTSDSMSPNHFILAYASVWPLFFAGTCALERLSVSGVNYPQGKADTISTIVTAAQVSWIIGRMDYIADRVGIMWARAIGMTLRSKFKMHTDAIPSMPKSAASTWYEEIVRTHRGPKNFTVDLFDDARPIWVGRTVGQNAKLG